MILIGNFQFFLAQAARQWILTSSLFRNSLLHLVIVMVIIIIINITNSRCVKSLEKQKEV